MYVFIKIAILFFTAINFGLLAKLFIVTKEIATVKSASTEKYSLVKLSPKQQVLIDRDVSVKINAIIKNATKIKKYIFFGYVLISISVLSLFFFN